MKIGAQTIDYIQKLDSEGMIASLILKNCYLGVRLFTKVLQLMIRSKSIVHLDLSGHNMLTQHCGIGLNKMIKSCPSLISINISSGDSGGSKNYLGDKGVEQLMEALEFNQVMSHMNLSGIGMTNLDKLFAQ